MHYTCAPDSLVSAIVSPRALGAIASRPRAAAGGREGRAPSESLWKIVLASPGAAAQRLSPSRSALVATDFLFETDCIASSRTGVFVNRSITRGAVRESFGRLFGIVDGRRKGSLALFRYIVK